MSPCDSLDGKNEKVANLPCLLSVFLHSCGLLPGMCAVAVLMSRTTQGLFLKLAAPAEGTDGGYLMAPAEESGGSPCRTGKSSTSGREERRTL